jgi:hypothetical protein
MSTITIAVWLVTAVAGSRLLYLWLAGAGLRRQKTKVTRFPITLVFGHLALGVGALALWAGSLVTGETAYAWTSFGMLTVAALLGFTMFTRWLGAGRHERGAEQGFPVVSVVSHGVAGLATFVLVLLSAMALSHLGG